MQLKSDPSPPLPIRIITFNIRYDCPTPEPHELPFSQRLPLLLQSLYFHSLPTPTIICLQEVLHHQLLALLSGLNDLFQTNTWRHIGFGREDGKQDGEYNPILYREDEWRLVAGEMKWLSPTPEVPSTGWGAACRRVFVRGLFEAVGEGGRRVSVVNTHFDHVSEKAREEEAKMVLEVMGRLVEAKGRERAEVVVLTGDLNSRLDQAAYRVLSAVGGCLKDARTVARVRVGNEITFTGFEGRVEDRERIDYVFVGGKAAWNVRCYCVGENGWDEGGLMSDHRPVVVDIHSCSRV